MKHRLARSAACLALVALPLAACGSDDDPEIEDPVDPEVPFDADVDDGIDTEVEQSGNLGFDEEQPGFDD